MEKNNSMEAYYDRLRTLANIKTPQKTTNLQNSTLINYVRDYNGVAYGIVKENHNYYIKKGNKNKNIDICDFTYIGGLENITSYQYKTLAEADKNRNMLIQNINESQNIRLNTTSTKLILEDVGSEIEKAEKKLPNLDKATENKKGNPIELPKDVELPEIPKEGESDAGIPNDDIVGDVENDAGGEDGVDAKNEVGSDINPDEPNLITKDIEKYLGKVTNLIRDTKLEPVKIKSYVNTYLSAFKDKLSDVDVNDRKKMADKILKIVSDNDIEDVGNSIEDDNNKNNFVEHLESRGYDRNNIHYCSDETLTEMISSYANSYNLGENNGSFSEVALFTNENILESLREEYGHNEYVDKIMEYFNQLSESTEEDRYAEINELSWSGIKGAFNKVGDDIKTSGQNMYDKTKGAIQKGVDSVKQYGNDIKQSYYSGETDALVKKLEKFGEELKPLLQNIDTKAKKAGRNPINLQSMFQRMMYQIRQNKPISLSGINEITDPTHIEVSPNVVEDEKLSNFDDVDSVVDFQEPTVSNTKNTDSSVSVDVDGNTKTVNIQMNESERKLRNYVIERMDVLTGKRRLQIDESKKSPKLRKLDNLIESEYNNILKEKENSKKEEKLRKYVREHLDIISGKKKSQIDESKKSEKTKKLDKLIESQYNLYKKEIQK